MKNYKISYVFTCFACWTDLLFFPHSTLNVQFSAAMWIIFENVVLLGLILNIERHRMPSGASDCQLMYIAVFVFAG